MVSTSMTGRGKKKKGKGRRNGFIRLFDQPLSDCPLDRGGKEKEGEEERDSSIPYSFPEQHRSWHHPEGGKKGKRGGKCRTRNFAGLIVSNARISCFPWKKGGKKEGDKGKGLTSSHRPGEGERKEGKKMARFFPAATQSWQALKARKEEGEKGRKEVEGLRVHPRILRARNAY